MTSKPVSLFDELVASGAVSPRDYELRAQIAKVEMIGNAIAAATSFVGRTVKALTGRTGSVQQPAVTVRRATDAVPANHNQSKRNAA